MDKYRALSVLLDAKAILNEMKLDYFLIDGTLLGAVREGNFIEHDNDLDIGVFSNQIGLDEFTELTYRMMSNGFLLYHSFGKFGYEFETAWFKDGIKLDFFFYHKICKGHDKLVQFHAFLEGGRKYPKGVITYQYKLSDIYPLKNVMLMDNIFKAPNNPLNVLEAKYGKDWKTPVKKWDWAYGPKNIVNKS